jgi:hypothetical protein
VCKPLNSIGSILRQGVAVNAALGWGLALVAVVAGYTGYGWRGVVLALTVVVFWLLLQFSRALRVMRQAAGKPKGTVANAVMLHAQLHTGMRLAQVMRLTGSFGEVSRAEANHEESFVWRDETGASVEVRLRGGKVSAWDLKRPT